MEVSRLREPSVLNTGPAFPHAQVLTAAPHSWSPTAGVPRCLGSQLGMVHLKTKMLVSTPQFGECREAKSLVGGWAWLGILGAEERSRTPGTETPSASSTAYDGFLASSPLPCSPLKIMGRLCSPEGSTCDLLAIGTRQDIYPSSPAVASWFPGEGSTETLGNGKQRHRPSVPFEASQWTEPLSMCALEAHDSPWGGVSW